MRAGPIRAASASQPRIPPLGAVCFFAAGAILAASGRVEAAILARLGRIDLPGAEIVAYDARGNSAFVTCAEGVAHVHLGKGDDAAIVRLIDVGAAVGRSGAGGGAGGGRCEATHVAVDPAGRGFGAITVLPPDRSASPGFVVLFSTRSCAPLSVLTVAHGPDSAAFSADGRFLVVANEGEPARWPGGGGGISDPPGSVSVISLAGVLTEADAAALSNDAVATVWFGGEAVAAALEPSSRNAAALRIHPANRATPSLDLEPESVAIVGATAYITLQENNAIAALDLETLTWVRVAGLGVIQQRIDASDEDGGAHIETIMAGMPMPDQIAAFRRGERAYLVTANEGDDRGEVGDESAAMPDMARAGRLFVCSHTGDDDGDGAPERPTMPGSRSLSVWDAVTMTRIADTGSAFEEAMAARAPFLFNATSKAGGRPDARSARRGPEPEGVTIGEVNGRTLAFVSLERPGAIAVVDLTNPGEARLVDLHVSAAEGDFGPEGVTFLPREASPRGEPLLLVAFETPGALGIFTIRDMERDSPPTQPRSAGR